MNVDIFNNLWSIIKTIQFRDVVDILAIALLVNEIFGDGTEQAEV